MTPTEIPISKAEKIAKTHGYDQVIIVGRKIGDDGLEWVTTYGKNEVHCEAAGKIGAAIANNVIPTIESLQERIKELELEVKNAGFRCTDDLADWVNTHEDSLINKTNVYEWVIAWRPVLPYVTK